MKRIVALDIAKGFAIVCVVLGHIVSRDSVPGADWYTTLKLAVYSFHMPLFMTLSGMALGLSWRHRASWRDVGELVGRRVRTLLIPYFVFGIVVVAGKLITSKFMHVDYAPDDFVHGIINVALYPMESPSMFLWYIQVLAMYFLIVPWLLQADAVRMPFVLLGLGIVMNQFDWTLFMNFAGFVTFLPFFAAGIIIGQHWNKSVTTVFQPRLVWLWLLPFAVAVAYSSTIEFLPKWFVGILSVPAIMCAAQRIHGKVAHQLEFLGNHTLSIYLMNTIFIGLAKAVMFPFVPWRDGYFIIYFIVLAFAGLVMPIAIKMAMGRVQPTVAAYI